MVGRYPMLEKNKAVHKTVLKVFLMSFWTSGRGIPQEDRQTSDPRKTEGRLQSCLCPKSQEHPI